MLVHPLLPLVARRRLRLRLEEQRRLFGQAAPSDPAGAPPPAERFLSLADFTQATKQTKRRIPAHANSPCSPQAASSSWTRTSRRRRGRRARKWPASSPPHAATLVRSSVALDSSSLNLVTAVIKRALPPDARSADILSDYSPEQGFQEVSVGELKEALQAAAPLLLLDVRSTSEFATGSIPGARSVPLEELAARARAGELGSPSSPIVVFCAGGTRSAQAAVRLKRVLGFLDVASLRGGMAAWGEG